MVIGYLYVNLLAACNPLYQVYNFEFRLKNDVEKQMISKSGFNFQPISEDLHIEVDSNRSLPI